MKCAALAMLLSVLARPALAQDPLRIFYEHSTQREDGDAVLEQALANLLMRLEQRVPALSRVAPANASRAPYAIPFDYFSPCSVLRGPAIVQTSPAKYLTCQNEFRHAPKPDTLIPIGIVQKYGLPQPYYSALIVARRDSPIRDLSPSAGITRFILADSTSTSGFVVPLHMLWQTGRIDRPTVDGAQRTLGQKLELMRVNDPRSVKSEVRRDSLAVGATGEYRTAAGEAAQLQRDSLKVIMRYDLIPQGVIAVTPDLARAADSVLAELVRFFAENDTSAKIIGSSSVGITGVLAFNQPEYVNAYRELEMKRARVAGGIPVGPISTLHQRSRLIRDVLIWAGALAVAIALGLGLADLKRKEGVLLCALFVGLGMAWFAVLFNPSMLSSPAFFLFLLLSAALGTTFRATARHFFKQPRTKYPFVEVTMGFGLAFGFTLLFFISDVALHSKFTVPPAKDDIQRVALVVALLSFGAALLIESGYTALTKQIEQRLVKAGGGGGAGG